MSETSPRIRFLFDYISSNAYLAWTQLPKLAARYGAVVEPVPVLFAGLRGPELVACAQESDAKARRRAQTDPGRVRGAASTLPGTEGSSPPERQ